MKNHWMRKHESKEAQKFKEEQKHKSWDISIRIDCCISSEVQDLYSEEIVTISGDAELYSEEIVTMQI